LLVVGGPTPGGPGILTLFDGAPARALHAWRLDGWLGLVVVAPLAGVYHHLVPDAVGRAPGSRRLVWLQLWLLVLVTGFTGPRLLLHGTAPGWLQSIGVAAGLLAWAPGWAGLL